MTGAPSTLVLLADVTLIPTISFKLPIRVWGLLATKQTQAVATPRAGGPWAPRFCNQQGPTSLGAPAMLPGKPVSLVQQNGLQLSWPL